MIMLKNIETYSDVQQNPLWNVTIIKNISDILIAFKY